MTTPRGGSSVRLDLRKERDGIISKSEAHSAPDSRELDGEEPCLRNVSGYKGIKDIQFITAHPIEMREGYAYRECT